jgi:uroporphyrinogen decarboxylase
MRTATLRGTEQWLIDLAEDVVFAAELAMRMTQHITAVGLEAIRRYDLYDTGIWFFDDLGSNRGPMFSPRTFERVFYPCFKWMCEQYRAAGVKHILLHCDGNIEAILDPLVDAGIQGLHPVEPKAGMDAVKLREKYGKRLTLIGALDNAHILPGGNRAEIESHVLRILEVGRDGGLIIGSHSIGPDVTIDTYDFVHEIISRYG